MITTITNYSDNLATCFVNTFEVERTATQAVAPQGTIHAPPTFTWRHDNSIGKDYPVFFLQIMEADGNLLASTGYLRAPARAADGTFSWRWPVDMSIRTNGVMLCGVRYELGGSVITTNRYLLGNKSYKWKVTMMDSKFTTVDDTNPATDFFNAFTNLYPTAETTP